MPIVGIIAEIDGARGVRDAETQHIVSGVEHTGCAYDFGMRPTLLDYRSAASMTISDDGHHLLAVRGRG